MRSVSLLLLLAACGGETRITPEATEDARPEPRADGFFTRSSVNAQDAVTSLTLHGTGDMGVITMDGMTCTLRTSTGTTGADEDVVPEDGGEIVVDSVGDNVATVALIRSGDRLLRAQAQGYLAWRESDLGLDHVVTAKLLPEGFVALRSLPEGCAADFWRWTDAGAEPYGGAWVDACDAGVLEADPETGRAWVIAGGEVVEVTDSGSSELGIGAERVAWDAAADALYTADGSVLTAWEADGTPRWTVRRVDARGLAAMPELGVAVVRIPDGLNGRLLAFDGVTGDLLHEARLTSPDGALVAAPAGRVVAAVEDGHRVVTWELR
jgi:hypothetical protein